jgi:DNA-binding NarL/FixJ family response regulator
VIYDHPSNNRQVRIYLVEDSPIMQTLLRDLLAGEAAVEVVGEASNAIAAAGEIAALRPDIAVVDIALENSNGFDLLRALRAQGKRAPVVMVLTNYATARFREEAKRLGAEYFFDKSSEIVRMLKTIVAIAALRRHRR